MSKEEDDFAVSYFPDESKSDEEESEIRTKSKEFLKFKNNKVKKNFKTCKLDRLQQQMIKVGQTLLDQKNRKQKQEKEQSLSTRSMLLSAPSDFEHVFHAQKSETQKLRELERKEEERKEEELLKKIFQSQCKVKDVMIPIYTVDESSIPRVVNVPLSKLNEMDKKKGSSVKIFAKQSSSECDKQTKKQVIPKMKTITMKTIKRLADFSTKSMKKDVKK